MKPKNVRRIVVLIIVFLSLLLLLWGIWPLEETIKTLRISPQDMQLPTPETLMPNYVLSLFL